MPVSLGTKLGPYEILAPIGAGGMGEVYRAKDTKLDREVAIKILPDALAQDPERLARFEREAKVLASLNHPNIAQIYGVEERALVMELVEGENLKGPLPVETALKYAKQIADALEAAHEKGIVHRDLKPANVKVTPEGVVKVLDFGLAKAADESTGSPNVANSPTLTMSPTRAGMILGTAAYMSPEQAHGKVADRRADIWSFGVVLYEMLAGKPGFTGESVSDILASVLKLDPDWSALPVGTPPTIRRLLRQCLKKDRTQRLQAIGDARIAIEEALSGGSQEINAVPAAVPRRNLLLWLVAAALAVVSIVLGVVAWHATRLVDRPLMRLSVDLGPDAIAGQFSTVTISPDGWRLVFPAKGPEGKQVLATRLLSETKPTLLSGTENGGDPFFSPDGKWIGFFANGKMKKISVQGGAPVVLCDAPYARGAYWGVDENIIVALDTQRVLSRVSAEGGTLHLVTKRQGSISQRWPQLLPGSEAVLFTLSASAVAFEDASIAAVSLKTGESKVLVRGGYFGRYLPSGDSMGHLVYVHDGVLFGVPFDPARLELRGATVPLLEDLTGDSISGAGFSFSRTGTFIYRTGKVSTQSWPVWWLDRSGKTTTLIATPGIYFTPRFSPDGQRLALLKIAGHDRGIFVYDWQRETMARLTSDTDTQQTSYPVWSPDGKYIAFQFRTARDSGLGWIRADGAMEMQHLLDSKNPVTPYSFFPDSRRLAHYGFDPDSGYDLWTLPLDVSDPDHPKPGKSEPFLRTPSNEHFPAASPDGRWIAYQSDESGKFEVYVRPFPGPGGKSQISNAGGQLPVWSRNGRELFFQNLDNRIMVADYEGKNQSFVHRKPQLWSNQQLHDFGGFLNYDLHPDGKRFAIVPEMKAPAEETGNVHVMFLENFFDELRRRAPVSK
jgi:Tol biopolymer transport system component/predicted Ser/Thr protein kinase